jgi:hypothetical protein
MSILRSVSSFCWSSGWPTRLNRFRLKFSPGLGPFPSKRMAESTHPDSQTSSEQLEECGVLPARTATQLPRDPCRSFFGVSATERPTTNTASTNCLTMRPPLGTGRPQRRTERRRFPTNEAISPFMLAAMTVAVTIEAVPSQIRQPNKAFVAEDKP